MDAEYYQPEYLELEKRLNLLNTKTVEEISKSVISFGAYSLTSYIEWQSSGVPYINVGDIHDGYIDFSNVKYISEKVDEILKKSRVSNGQVLLTMAGTIGNAAMAYNLSRTANANQAIAKITPLDSMSPYYLAAFLNSKYGLLQTQREIVSSVQANIFLGPIKKFKIPIFDRKITEDIGGTYKNFLNKLENSKSLYSQAENLLLEELGLKNFENENCLFAIVSLLKVKDAHRIDAEYFQGEYKKITDKVEKYKGGWDFLENLTEFINNGNQPPYSENGDIKFFSQKWIKDKEIDYSFLTDKNEPKVSKTFFEDKKNATYLIRKYDILYYSVGANLGYCHNYLEDENIAIGSFINLIRADKGKINPVFLGFVLNSVVGRMQAKMNKSGLAQPYIYAKNLRKFEIPILPKSIQQKIADLVQKSHEARRKAKELLEQAKQKVEELIEEK